MAIIKNNRIFDIVPGTNEDDDHGCDHQHIRFMKHKSKPKSAASRGQKLGGDSIYHHTSIKRYHKAQVSRMISNDQKKEQVLLNSGDYPVNRNIQSALVNRK